MVVITLSMCHQGNQQLSELSRPSEDNSLWLRFGVTDPNSQVMFGVTDHPGGTYRKHEGLFT